MHGRATLPDYIIAFISADRALWVSGQGFGMRDFVVPVRGFAKGWSLPFSGIAA